MPESTLTPAPVSSVTLPGERNCAIRSTATAGETGVLDVVVTACGIVGTETLIQILK
ncbi:hypothetical protein PISMIDRAFT_678867 [Pisolithus microcarpus 441]|uniref:Uncharacterized protein n=1 Tax=Pisolithus microcarpus 441 TaxID=765257 RepID=A0A0C9YG17_9AGAM|nr:hypothetical protein PISMIDRAFT_678867 [Pisolithus microcarpus 441]